MVCTLVNLNTYFKNPWSFTQSWLCLAAHKTRQKKDISVGREVVRRERGHKGERETKMVRHENNKNALYTHV